ncbi:Arylsulfatase [Pirellulimonas nuda]|uniref:Arylsulfatase n=1 Tax=Pirellulimonas nuda TaxID=2528009 RepID=A0A518D8P4_9BACT|nr:sulfatase [Pirellulimonas nuda]QDU87845.1 Arylsulfatase [Pirellulimonas nuda]
MNSACPRWTRPCCTLLLLMAALAVDAAPRPNIVLIFADDLGWKDVGYQGTDFYETPNLDRLAGEGMVFTDAYATAGNCAPSRACLLSGQYTPRHGVFAVQSTKRGPVREMRMEPVPNNQTLALANVTLAEALRSAGYATGCFGKWHLGQEGQGTGPQQQGFDVYFDSRKANPNRERDATTDPKGTFSNTEAACRFIAANKDRSFFAYVAHHAIHSTLEARPETLRHFEQKPPGKQHRNVKYAGCTYDLDAGVGVLLEKLKALGLEENTLVVFTSDNGATGQSSQEPLRGAKGGYYEGGIREPFIVRWPAVTRPGSRCSTPVSNIDLYPTFLAAAGAEPPAGKVLDGESLLPLLQDSRGLERKSLYWHFPGYLDKPVLRGRDRVFRTRPVSVVRRGDWKLHLYHEEWLLDGGRGRIAANNAVELYDLSADIGERHNLANENPEKRDELLDDLLGWITQIDAPLPTARAKD